MLPDQKPIERKEDPNKPEVPLSARSWVIIYACILIIPAIIGTILYFVLGGDIKYLEILYAVAGVIVLLAMMFRMRIRDGRNLKKTKSVVEDKKSDSYQNYKKSQFLLFVLGALCLLLSFIVFLIGFLIYK